MIKVAIIGGKLQGTEATFLARLAGYKSILIDSNSKVPASGFCDEFICGDVCKRDEDVIAAMKRADFVLPAMENEEVLQAIVDICDKEKLKLAFDMEAYKISSSKIKTDKLIHENKIPAPEYYPDCEGPYIIKPSGESGSTGVRKAETREEVEEFLLHRNDKFNWIVEEYLSGPSYSIEVIGNKKEYRTYKITKIHMDEVYDCCRVTAPCKITPEQEKQFHDIAIKLAKMVNLTGIMDVEVIDYKGQFKVLEIDARIPSQTPLTVYYSTGINLIEELADIVLYGEFTREKKETNLFASYEHFNFDNHKLHQMGEHIMGEARPLVPRENLLNADVVISDLQDGVKGFKGIFINSAETEKALEAKRKKMISTLKLLP